MLAFEGLPFPILLDWRLRECDYGDLTRIPRASCTWTALGTSTSRIPTARAGGRRSRAVGRFLTDLPTRWDGRRVLVIGHVATRWGLEHFLNGVPLEDLVDADFQWQEGWEYVLP